ncbi:hypothetical protein [Sphingomonas montana]|uniref:hypothetical protein n=1 Tax=Sphingomonas montana TaxID=1843236 RepID=UPI00096EE8AF|nr:hypothetical protein [Sphingomonas montana]
MYRPVITLSALSALVATTAAMAAAPLEISSRMLVEKRVAARDGTTRIDMVAAEKVVPGDRVTFVVAYRNTTRQPIADVVLANPVPRAVAYRGVGAGTPAPDVSVDGRTFAPMPALRVGTTGGGMRPATADDVVAVRWRLPAPVAAGASGQLAFQGVLR